MDDKMDQLEFYSHVDAMLDGLDDILIDIYVIQEKQLAVLQELLELSKSKRKVSTPNRFQPPSVQDVTSYVKEINARIDPSAFVDYYTARGWKLNGGQTVKDWKACVRTWSRNGFSKDPTKENDKTGAVL
jgi:hypothetical protein